MTIYCRVSALHAAEAVQNRRWRGETLAWAANPRIDCSANFCGHCPRRAVHCIDPG